MLTPDYQRDWPAYSDAVAGQPARETLVRALDAFEREDGAAPTPTWRTALDIGCGSGRDTLEMLRRAGPTRWRVMATDTSGIGLQRLGETLGEAGLRRVGLAACSMENLPVSYRDGVRIGTERLHRRVGLVNASFALPFCHEDSFAALWEWIGALLTPGGRFAGQLFGDRDEWATINPRRHHTRGQVMELFAKLELEHFEEVEKKGSDAMGGVKRHHVFHIVARTPR